MPAHDDHDLTEDGLVRARELVPIACVDVLPWRRAEGCAPEVCLIERLDRPGQWNLVGGRIRRGEQADAAVRRHLLSTLGPRISWTRNDFSRPEVVGQHFSECTAGYGFDPRHRDGVTITDADGNPVQRDAEQVEWDAAAAEKGGYETFMLKEIHEQADAVAETIVDRLPTDDGVDLDVDLEDSFLRGLRRVVIVDHEDHATA